jgi:hypothetical protein
MVSCILPIYESTKIAGARSKSRSGAACSLPSGIPMAIDTAGAVPFADPLKREEERADRSEPLRLLTLLFLSFFSMHKLFDNTSAAHEQRPAR